MIQMEIFKKRLGAFAKQLFDGTCDIYEYAFAKDQTTGVLDKSLVATVSEVPCHLAYMGSPSAGTGGAADLKQRVRLFLSAGTKVKAGSLVIVTQNGRTAEYVLAGEPEIYNTHQEIELISRKREAWKGAGFTDSIITGVASAINKCFDGDYAIYTEKVEQGLKRPCFFICAERDTVKRCSIGRYKRELFIRITYLPKDMKENAEMEEAALMLCRTLEMVSAGESALRGDKMDWRVSDGRLLFTARFTVSMLWDSEGEDNGTELMEEVAIGFGE